MLINWIQTRHAQARARKRGMRDGDIELVAMYGTPVSGGYILRRKDIAPIEQEVKRLIERLYRLQGVFVASNENVFITAFHATKGQQCRRIRNLIPQNQWSKMASLRIID